MISEEKEINNNSNNKCGKRYFSHSKDESITMDGGKK